MASVFCGGHRLKAVFCFFCNKLFIQNKQRYLSKTTESLMIGFAKGCKCMCKAANIPLTFCPAVLKGVLINTHYPLILLSRTTADIFHVPKKHYAYNKEICDCMCHCDFKPCNS